MLIKGGLEYLVFGRQKATGVTSKVPKQLSFCRCIILIRLLGAGLGTRPTTNTGNTLIDAIVWVKPPGESDGTSNSSAPRYDTRMSHEVLIDMTYLVFIDCGQSDAGQGEQSQRGVE